MPGVLQGFGGCTVEMYVPGCRNKNEAAPKEPGTCTQVRLHACMKVLLEVWNEFTLRGLGR